MENRQVHEFKMAVADRQNDNFRYGRLRQIRERLSVRCLIVVVNVQLRMRKFIMEVCNNQPVSS